MGLPFPEEYGGAGADTVSYALAVMEIARADASTAITMAAHVSLGATPFYLFGTEEQKQRYLVPLAQGKMLWGFGLTEPNAGSDAGNVQTKAALQGRQLDHQRHQGLHHQLGHRRSPAARRSPRSPARGPTASPRSRTSSCRKTTPGFTRSKKYKKMGWRASDTRELSFVDAKVPEEQPARASEARAIASFSQILDGGRISVAALSVGLAMGAYDEALAVREGARRLRQTDQQVPGDLSSSSSTCSTEIEHAKLMMLHAAWEKDEGRDFEQTASFAKLYSGEVSHRVVNEALQIHGGYGFMDEYPVSRMYRDQKINEIGEGTNEVQRLVLARMMGL